MVESARRLIVLSCARRKRSAAGLLPAIERYDGPTFRVLRRYLITAPSDPPIVYILSAEHGLIAGEYPIACYERTMTSERADQLKEVVLRRLGEAIDQIQPTTTLILAGQHYARLLAGDQRLAAARFPRGSLGRQVAVLHDWLYGAPPQGTPTMSDPDHVMQSWRGIPLPTDRDALLAASRNALGRWAGALPVVNSWYVEVDGQQIPLKWLLSQLTGLPVHSFHSSDARRILGRLGVEVSRA